MSTESVVCERCGAALTPGAIYCESCGRPLDADAVRPRQDCPKCGRSDQSFSAEDFCSRTFSDAEDKAADESDKWGPTFAQCMLEKPEEPEAPNLGLWVVVPLIPLVNFIACWFAPMRRGHKFFMLGILIVFLVCASVPEINKTAAYAFVGCFFILFYYVALFLDRGRQESEYLTRRLPEYRMSLPRWGHLRYCQRCEVVWLDGDAGRWVGVDKTPEIMKG